MPDPELSALVVDWGGVLTNPLQDTMQAWCETDRIDYDRFAAVMRDWLGESYGDDVRVNPVHALERGEMEVPHFEAELARRLTTHDGHPVAAEGLLTRMFAGFGKEPTMVDVVRRARHGGIRTALCSNSWGLDYPREGWDELFDAIVISGEVGMRKPEPQIYRHTAALLGVPPQECVFVDDLRPNVLGAVEVGMVGVQHVTTGDTVIELEALFGVRLGGEGR